VNKQNNTTIMAKKNKDLETAAESKEWKEAMLIKTFKLNRITQYQTPLMKEWLSVENLVFDVVEQSNFDRTYKKGVDNIAGWSEEDLKMKFISPVLDLGLFDDENGIIGYFEKTISATVEGTFLKVKSDFMMAKGILDVYETPYFHFQEYKPYKNPSGDSMAQLLEAFLIAQETNKNNKPLYGIDIMGKQWTFVLMEGKDYCTSPTFICTEKDDLLKIIAILRKFKHILMTRLIFD
jgi:hypothetical protein